MTPPWTVCRTCGASVIWVKSDKTGRSMPLDALPSDRGNTLLLPSGRAIVLGTSADVAFIREAGIGLRISHHVTCAHPPESKK